MSENLLENQKVGLVWDKILRIGLMLLVFLAPIFFLPFTNSPLYLNKQAFVVFLTLILFVAWVFRFITKGSAVLPKGLILFSLIALLIVLAVSSFFSISLLDSIRVEAQPLSLILMATLIFFCFFLSSEIAGGLELDKPFFLLLGSISLITVVSFLQIFGFFIFPFNFARNISFNVAGSHNSFAFLAAAALISLAVYLTFGKNVSKIKKVVLAILFAMLILFLALVNYQVVWYLLALISIGVVIASIVSGNRRELVNLRSVALIILICVISVFFIISNDPLIFVRPQLPLEILPSFSGTAYVVQNVFKEGILKFALGSGPATFSHVWDLYKPQTINQTAFWNTKFFGSYSTALTFLVENGVIGGLVLLVFLASFILLGLKMRKNIKGNLISADSSVVLLSSFSGGIFLLTAWFLYPPSFSLNVVLFAFLGILWGGLSYYDKNGKNILKFPEKVNSAVIFTLVLIGLIILGVSGLYLEGQHYLAAVYVGAGQDVLNRQGAVDQAINSVSKAIIMDRYEDSYPRILSQMFLFKLNQIISGGDSTGAQTVISNAIDSAKQAVNDDQAEYLNWKNLASIYENLVPIVDGADGFVATYYQEAQKRNPTSPEIYLGLARGAISSFDKISRATPQKSSDIQTLENAKKSLFDRALTDINYAISLKQNYVEAYMLRAQVYDREKEGQKALADIKTAEVLSPNDQNIYFQAGFYEYRLQNYTSAEQELLAALSLDPNYSNAMYFLGLVYDKEGKKDLAITEFEKIGSLNPTNTEIKQILNNLRAGKPALSGISSNESSATSVASSTPTHTKKKRK